MLMKSVVACLLTALILGAVAWINFGQDKVTRAEMIEHVAASAPWVFDRGEITAEIKGNSSDLVELKSMVTELVKQQTEFLVEQRLLAQKFDSYLDNH